MEFEFLVEDGEFFVEDAEVERLMEETGLSEDEVMDIVSDTLNEGKFAELKQKIQNTVEAHKQKRYITKSQNASKKLAKKGQNVMNVGSDGTAQYAKSGELMVLNNSPVPVGDVRNNKRVKLPKPGMSKNAKIAAGAVLGTAALAGGAYAAKKLLDKRKAKKAEDKDAQTVQECMVDIILREDAILISDSELDFLLEACDYELTTDEILDNLAESVEEELNEGILQAVKDKVDDFKKDRYNAKERKAYDKVVGKGGTVIDVDPNGNTSYRGSNMPAVVNNSPVPVGEVRNNPRVRLPKGGMSKNAKIAAGAVLGTAALAGGAYALNKVLKKRKAKKEADKEAQTVQECMIDLVQDGEYILVSESDMDFLLEACDYELTQEEILANLAEAKEVDECFPGDGIVAVTSDKVMAEVRERQSVDMDEEHCDNGMMADCSVAPETKQRIKKPKCMHEDVEYDDEELNEGMIEDYRRRKADKLDRKAAKYASDHEANIKAWDDAQAEDKEIHEYQKEKQQKRRDRYDERVAKNREKDLKATARKAEKARAKADSYRAKKLGEDVEYDEYLESFEGDHLINEAILDDADIRLSEDEMFDLIAENLLSERSVVRLDKAAKRSQAEAKALVVIAREQNDPLYKKLVKCYKQKQAILAQLDAKYGSRAIARVRKNAGKMNVDK